jgi:hypothetical protein
MYMCVYMHEHARARVHTQALKRSVHMSIAEALHVYRYFIVLSMLCPFFILYPFLCHSAFEMLPTHVDFSYTMHDCVLVFHCVECVVFDSFLYPFLCHSILTTHVDFSEVLRVCWYMYFIMSNVLCLC